MLKNLQFFSFLVKNWFNSIIDKVYVILKHRKSLGLRVPDVFNKCPTGDRTDQTIGNYVLVGYFFSTTTKMLGQVYEITAKETARILLSHLLMGNVTAVSLRLLLLLNLLLRHIDLVVFSRCSTCLRGRYCTNDYGLLSLSYFTQVLTLMLTSYTNID